MASPNYHLPLLSLLLLTLISFSEQTQTATRNQREKHHHRHNFRPTGLFVFGDSYADTGNSKKGMSSAWKVPYGTTFPGKPSGRFSDGQVLTDYVGNEIAARFLGMKSPVPYEMRKMMVPQKMKKGMNFAFGGAGVFDTYIGIPNISAQIDYFERLIKQKAYTGAELTNSVALVSVAGNDYAHYMAANGSFQALPSFMASVVKEMSLNLMRLHALGVKRIVVTALEPLGCLPLITDLFSLPHCYYAFNNLAILHNRLLDQHLLRLNRIAHKHNHHSPTFLVLDLFTSFTSVLSHPFAYNISQPFKPCCVGVNSSYWCASVDDDGDSKVKRYSVCDNPRSAFFWDSLHPSDVGWRAVFTRLRTIRSFRRLRT